MPAAPRLWLPEVSSRPLRFLVPGTGSRFRCGGLSVELQTARLCQGLAPDVEVVTYRARDSGRPFLRDLLAAPEPPDAALWIVSWGFHVPQLLRQLQGRPVAYHAHSSGYGFDLPAGVPVLAVSRNTLGYWGNRSPRSPLQWVPNPLDPAFMAPSASGMDRPLDVLVQQRKSSAYVRDQLLPALQRQGLHVELQQGWVDDLAALFRRARVVLYDSADHWRRAGVSEGFGLPPLEALASGCVVFSSINHALADTLDPGQIAWQIGRGTLSADVERIASAVRNPQQWRPDPAALQQLLAAHQEEAVRQRWADALAVVNDHWDRLLAGEPALSSLAPWRLRWGRRLSRLLGSS